MIVLQFFALASACLFLGWNSSHQRFGWCALNAVVIALSVVNLVNLLKGSR